jgi:hypothetical protein
VERGPVNGGMTTGHCLGPNPACRTGHTPTLPHCLRQSAGEGCTQIMTESCPPFTAFSWLARTSAIEPDPARRDRRFREAHCTVSTAKQGRHRTHEDSPAKLYGFAATPCSASATQCPPRLI